jgi:AmmeMemoRadiSam system protein B
VANDWDMPAVPQLRAAWTSAADPIQAGHLYGRTYAALRHVAPCTRILALGWCAAQLDGVLASTARAYATPLGSVAIDSAALALIPPARRDELAHVGSSSLARQASFLRLVQRATPWLPVLVSAPRDLDPNAVRGVPAVEAAVEQLARVLELPGETFLLCAADLTQRISVGVGIKPLSARPVDVEAVDAALALRADDFFAVAGRRDPRRAFAPYLMLRLLERFHPALRGSTLGYRQLANGPEHTSAASVVFQP